MLLLVVDLQERLMPAIHHGDEVILQASKLLQAAQQLEIPVVVSEQYPQGLGHTVEVLQPYLQNAPCFEKTTFSALAHEPLSKHVAATKARTLVLCGAESHICVAQTAEDALMQGYNVHLITDAIGSRRKADYKTALLRLTKAGAIPHTVESLVFRWMHDAQHPNFKAVQALFKH